MRSTLIILLLTGLTLSSCKKATPRTTIAGVLPNQPNSELRLIPVEDYFPGLETDGDYPKARTDSLGYFVFSLDSINEDFYKITQNSNGRVQQDLYLESGDSIFVNVPKYKTDEQFHISGKGSEKLQYLVSDWNIFPKSAEFYTKIRSSDFETEMDFKRYIDSIHKIRLKGVDTMFFKTETLKQHHLKTLNAERAELLLSHLEYRNYRMNNFFAYFHPEEAYYQFLDDLDLAEDVSNNTAVKKLAGPFLTNKAEMSIREVEQNKQWEMKFGARFEYVTKQEPSSWNDQLLMSVVNQYSMAMLQDNFFETLERYDDAIDQAFLSEQAHQLFKDNVEIYANLAPGKPAPDFELPDANGTMVRLSDLKGKIVYIDFWGTWCGPCIQEIPAALELQNNFAEDIEFLYVALEYGDEDIERWKEFIAGNTKTSQKLFNNGPFPGVHLVADKQFNNEALKPYSLNFAPTHVLIDRDGRIIDARADGAAYVSEQLSELVSVSKKGTQVSINP
jgi:thiol-disulfide isomerase/thioredoxin